MPLITVYKMPPTDCNWSAITSADCSNRQYVAIHNDDYLSDTFTPRPVPSGYLTGVLFRKLREEAEAIIAVSF